MVPTSCTCSVLSSSHISSFLSLSHSCVKVKLKDPRYQFWDLRGKDVATISLHSLSPSLCSWQLRKLPAMNFCSLLLFLMHLANWRYGQEIPKWRELWPDLALRDYILGLLCMPLCAFNVNQGKFSNHFLYKKNTALAFVIWKPKYLQNPFMGYGWNRPRCLWK